MAPFYFLKIKMDRYIYINDLREKGATEEEIAKVLEYENARNALAITRKVLKIDSILNKYDIA